MKKTQEQVIEEFKNIHGEKYDYSKFVYKGVFEKSIIICPIHGEFLQDAHSHILHKAGCPECGNKLRDIHKWLTQDQILERFKIVHGEKYDYSKVLYTGIDKKVCIICPKHGEFFQEVNSHIKGSGCPKCKNSKLENTIMIFLKSHKINFEYQYRENFLERQSIDFYLPDYGIGIECQGLQHYKPIKLFGGQEQFEKQCELDKLKYKKCADNNIELIYFTTCKIDSLPKNTFNSLKTLWKFLKTKTIKLKND